MSDYLTGGSEIKRKMDKSYKDAYTINSSYWAQGAIDKRFKVGDQTLWSLVYGENQYSKGKKFFFNLIKRHVNMIAGFQRRNRKSTVAIPISTGDESLTSDYTALLSWSENRDNFQEIFSNAFEGALDTGMNLLHLYPSYINDPISGDLFTDNISYNNFLIDPYFRKQDLSDCNYIWRRRWVSKNEAKALVPGMADKIDGMSASGAKDGRFPLQAELINLDTNNLFAYDEYYYRSFREATIVLDPKSGEAVEWEENDDDEEDELERTLAEQPWLVVKKIQKPTVKLAICMGSECIYDGPNLLKIDDFPFVPMLCYYEPDIQAYAWRVQGIVRNLRDAQYLYNKRKIIELDILESQINSGWVYPVDAVVDETAFRQTGQGFLIPLKTGHLPGEIERITPPDIPVSMIEISRSLSEDITKISGVNEELLGAATDDKSGILSMLRQGAGITTLQPILDKADFAQRLYGKIRLSAIRKNFSKGKVEKILGHEVDRRFFMSDSQKYDIAIEEGIYSTTQKQMEFQQLLHFREIGMPIPDEAIIRTSNIQNKEDLVELMGQQAQAEQQAQEAANAEQQEVANADKMSKFAKSKSDLALAKERMSNVAVNMMKMKELDASAEHKESLADLELTQKIIELEDMDREGLRKALELAEIIKSSNNENEKAEIINFNA